MDSQSWEAAGVDCQEDEREKFTPVNHLSLPIPIRTIASPEQIEQGASWDVVPSPLALRSETLFWGQSSAERVKPRSSRSVGSKLSDGAARAWMVPVLAFPIACSSPYAPAQLRVTTVQLRGGHPLIPPAGLHACTPARFRVAAFGSAGNLTTLAGRLFFLSQPKPGRRP